MAILKRSVLISGHSTSISIENEFWDELKAIANSKNTSITKLIEEIDKTRTGNLSSSIRLYVLKELKAQTPN